MSKLAAAALAAATLAVGALAPAAPATAQPWGYGYGWRHHGWYGPRPYWRGYGWYGPRPYWRPYGYYGGWGGPWRHHRFCRYHYC